MYLNHDFPVIAGASYGTRTSELTLFYADFALSYRNVPQEVYQQLIEAASPEDFRLEFLSGRYASTTV